VRCEVVERDRHGRLVAKVFSPNGVDIGRKLVSAEGCVPAVLDGLRRRRGPKGQARDVAGHLRQTLGVARIVTAAGNAGSRFGYKRQQAAGHLKFQQLADRDVFDDHRRCWSSQSSFQAAMTTQSQSN
jgi:hypothetical protein